MPAIQESWTCCERFSALCRKKTGQKYSKADAGLYRHLKEKGDEETAIQTAQQKYDQCLRDGHSLPSQMCLCTTVHELAGEIKNKAKQAPENTQRLQ